MRRDESPQTSVQLIQRSHHGSSRDRRHSRRDARIYEQLIPGLFPDGKLPEGWQVHIAGPTENGWRIVNVVPSREQFEAFAREQLNPATQQVGEGTPQLTFFPVHKLIRS
jgi:hypothetical protein